MFFLLKEKDKEEQSINKLNNDVEAGEEITPDINIINNDNYEEKVRANETSLEREHIPIMDYYGKTFIRVFSRDPNWLYCYWEINNTKYFENTPILRVYKGDFNTYKDITINHYSKNWYLGPISANTRYQLVIGYKINDIFYPLAYSNIITTPPEGPSHIIDEHWMTIKELDYYTYKIDVDSYSMIKGLKRKKKAEEINVDSFSFTTKE